MKRLLVFIVIVSTLFALSCIAVDKYTAYAPSLVEAEEKEDISQSAKRVEIEIAAVGDVMFHMPQVNGARLPEGGFDFNSSFKYIKPYIEEADIAIVNLETVIGGNEKGFSGFPRFNSPVETLDALKAAGFNILITANNHSLDGGKNGIINTINEIENRDLEYIGTSKEERKPYIIIEKEGLKIGLLSYTYGLNGLDSLLSNEERAKMVNLIHIESIQKDIKSLNNQDVDFIISYMHWGNEYHREASEAQRKLANTLAALGVDLILGSHPHVIQNSERIPLGASSSYVVYSMGNFLSNQRYKNTGVSYTEDGVIFRAKIIKNIETGMTILEELDYQATWIFRKLENNRYKHYIIPIEKALNGQLDIEFSQETIERLEKSKMDTLKLLNN